MTSKDDWENIQRIFEHAQSLELEQRSYYIEQACGDNEELLDKIRGMLQHVMMEDDPLEKIVGTVSDSIVHESLIGETIDRFKLLKSLGRGGMGEVFLAERIDDEFRQQVAIKIIHRGKNIPEITKMFQVERQLLAEFSHQYICRLLDGGTTKDGRLYIVMEYIVGHSIEEYCELKKLSMHERLRLFIKVCEAVQIAHQRLIVHCDLKPSNILIREDGIPKLLDFGIAKLISKETVFEEETQKNMALTYNYASPELLMGHSPQLSSDVFSLGIILFELMTDAHPAHIAGTTIEKVKRYAQKETLSEPIDYIG